MPDGEGFRFDAFISYSHARSARISSALQSGLERFARPWYRGRAMRLFRDQTNLGVTPELWGDIRSAMAQSRWFILIASPEAAASPWVRREVEWWLANRSADRLLLVVDDGGLRWDDVHDRFDVDASTALPEPLLTAFAEEPLWIDLTATGEGSQPYSEAELERGVAAIAARIRGLPLDAVIGEHLREQRRTRRIVVAVVASLTVLTVLASTATVVAVHQRDDAERAADRAAGRGAVLQSRNLRATQVDSSLLTGIAAAALAPGSDARTNLVSALVGSRYAGTVPGPSSGVTAVRFAPTGRLAVSAHVVGGARLWDVTEPAHARPVATLDAEQGAVRAVAFSPDGSVLAAGGEDATVTLWGLRDPTRPVLLARLTGYGAEVRAVAFDATGTQLFTAGVSVYERDDGVLVWDVAVPGRARRVAHIPGTGLVLGLAVRSPDRLLAVAGTEGVVLWSVDGDRPRRRGGIRTTLLPIYAGVFSPDGRLLVTASGERTVFLWDVSDPDQPRKVSGLPTFAKPVFACDLSRDGRTLAVADGDGVVTLWAVADPAHPVELARLPGHTNIADAVAFSADGALVMSGGGDGRALVWTTAVTSAPVRVSRTDTGAAAVTDVATGPDGGTVVVTIVGADTDGPTRSVSLRDLTGAPPGTPLGALPEKNVTAFTSLSPDGRTLLTGATKERMAVWNVEDPARPRLMATLDGVIGVDAAAWSADSTRVLLTGQLPSSRGNGAATLWDFSVPTRPMRNTPGGFGGDWFSAGAMSADGRVLALASGQVLDLWDGSRPDSPRLIGRMGSHPAVIRSVAFDPTGGVLATGSNDQTVVLWRVDRRQRLTVLQGHPEAVNTVRFSPDGTMLASLDDAGAMRLWDVGDPGSPVHLHTIAGGTGDPLTSLAFSHDSRRIIVGRGDGGLEVWDIGRLHDLVTDPVAAACAVTGRGLTRDEWGAHVPDRPYRRTC
ncbi:TIR domain-containing protein [Micromonospora sp. CPCC 206060]|uniref:TIR domain-containing protein n=1 Tax=Micromonospora sp. CPCC 206060 TaxID=3122406 RepID=UPI002FF37961